MHVPDAARARGVKIQWKRGDRLAILCHLKAYHTQNPIPDTGMIIAHPLARDVPQVARESIHTMRLAGMYKKKISSPCDRQLRLVVVPDGSLSEGGAARRDDQRIALSAG